MHGLQKQTDAERRATSSGNPAPVSPSSSSRRLEPDPTGHARALIEACGAEGALQIAEIYAQSYPKDYYWPRVFAEVSIVVRRTRIEHRSI